MDEFQQAVKVIEIRDPALDEDAIRQQIAARLAHHDDWDVTEIGPDSLKPHHTTPAASPNMIQTQTLNKLIIDLLAQEPLHEVPFSSSAPGVGPLIVAVRRAWNWMSTKWYVRPLIQQQARLNQQLILLLDGMVQQQETSARRLTELEAELAQLKAQRTEQK